MRVSLRTIARETGLNVSTVSRALREFSSVDAETRRVVQAVARRLGYVRDPLLANALTFARRTDKPVYRETMAFLASVAVQDYAQYPWLVEIHAGAARRAAELGYGIERFRIPVAADRQRALGRQLRSRGMRGSVVCPVHPVIENSPVSLDMDWAHLTGVEIGHSLQEPTLPRVVRYLADDSAMMLERLHARGYRRIGLAMHRQDEETRRWAVLSACMLFVKFHRDTRFSCLFDAEADYSAAAFARWRRKFKPDVLIVNGPGVSEWVTAEGMRVPEDVGICRIDCIAGREESGLRVDYEHIGATAVNQLASILERGESNPMGGGGRTASRPTMSIPSIWHEGRTLRAQRMAIVT
ncbi:LacI family DNA-binding transcriptional regulator [Geminisphaera colitermitum]|uniref:LacI family DNA-binding transcriptional regulator n=1 Tax=Geminisphaera colitermitum TaxID=1148786 RepID=UPI000158C864|nr:LacI family DNA-binding transcriptional regulator [Geminisphaera colitermitum]